MISFTFEQAEYLWFLFAIPFMAVTHFFLLRNAKRRALKFANFAVLKRATGQHFLTKNYTVLILRCAVIACAVFAAAETSIWYDGTTNDHEYVIALDTSASMSAQDFSPTRLAASAVHARGFISSLDAYTRVGLVSFSGIVFIEQPLTLDRGDLYGSLDGLEIEASGTDLAGAVITATNLLATSERGRALILITDGSNTIETFTSKSLQRAAQYALINRVKIYTIGVGTPDATPIGYLPQYYNVTASYNRENLEFLSNMTGGASYDAFDDMELTAAYADIHASDTTSKLKKDLTPGLMLTTLALILLEWGFISTRFRSLP